MKILITVLLTLLTAAAVSAGSIVGYKALTSHSEPDIVVAVSARCQQRVSLEKTVDMTGSQCLQGDRIVHTSSTTLYYIINSRLQITVRTSEGSTYQVDTPLTTNVSVGDPWPQ
jgi:nitrous oxidase accessory protein NosD